jgi:hypothetical protein
MTTIRPDRSRRGPRPGPRAAAAALAFACLLATGAPAVAGGDDRPRGVLARFRPAGGWSPDGAGLIHWWNPRCFPRCGGPDDYCRKPTPAVCWPPYPPYYVLAPQGPRVPSRAAHPGPVGP